MILAEGAPDLMQRLSRPATTPHVALLRSRKPVEPELLNGQVLLD